MAIAPYRQASAQNFGHTDVHFDYGPDKIEINDRTFTSFFPTVGISRQFQTLPGFASETDAGLGVLPNDEFVYNVLSDLQYWSDGSLQPALARDIQIRVRNRPLTVEDTIVSSQSGEQPGSFQTPRNRIGRATDGGSFHSDLQWFLESTDDDVQPPQGTYAMKLDISTDRAGIANSDPFYFIWHYGAEEDDFNSAVAFFDAQLTTPSVAGDFDGNGQIDVNDAETLVVEIRGGTRELRFDLDGDGGIDLADMKHWVSHIAATWQGDVDLNREFSSSDLVLVFQASRYETGEEATWSEGDWNADGLFGSSDLVLAFQDGGYEQGPRPLKAVPVPEPSSVAQPLVGLLFVWLLGRTTTTRCRSSLVTAQIRPEVPQI